MQSLNIYWESYVPGDGATKVRKTQSLPSDRSTETNKKAIPNKISAEKGKHMVPKKCYPTQIMQEGFFGGEESPCSGKVNRVRQKNQRCEGKETMAFQQEHAPLWRQKSDVFVELEVAQCG